MATAIDIINGALRLIGVGENGETLEASEAQSAMSALNLLFDAWGLTSLVYVRLEQVLTWPGGFATRTIGPSGNIIGVAPLKVSPDPFLRINGLDYPLEVISQEEYNSLFLKNISTSIPLYIVANETNPNITLTLYPKPSADVELHLWSPQEFTPATALTSDVILPPGYGKAVKYNLACDLAPEYGVQPSPTVQREAMNQSRIVGRSNYRKESHVMVLPGGLSKQKSNIFTG